MSIKDLFGKSTNYVSDTNQKDAFSDAESSRNVKAISEKQSTFEPQIDYSDPQTCTSGNSQSGKGGGRCA